MKIAEAADAIVSVLKAGGLNAFSFQPDTANPPLVFVRWQRMLIVDQYTRLGMGRGCGWVRELPVTICVGRESERDLRQRLDQLEQQVIDALESSEQLKPYALAITEMTQPEPMQALGGISCVLEDIVCRVQV